MQIEDFSLGKCIGKGSFGEVYLTTRKGSNKLYATKKISKQKIESPSIKKHFLDEIEILKTLNHKNIIKLETIRQSPNNFYIISEYYNGGGLYDCLRQYKIIYGKPFPENVVQHFMRQIIDALIYLHQRKIIHRDLKLENLLINFDSEEDKNNLNLIKAEVKIIDFGFATHMDGSHLRYSVLGSPINMDPILLTKLNNQNISYLIGYDEKADIWSLGTVCYEMATGEMIFQVLNVNQLIQRVEIGIYHIPTNLSQELVSFLVSMLQYFGKDRLSAVELSSHPFLTRNVSEFHKIDLSNPNNKYDAYGLIVNIKKENNNGNNAYEIFKKLNINPFATQSYNNINNNYYGNTKPKYYRANLNRVNYGNQYYKPQYNQTQIMKPYQNPQTDLRRINTYQQQDNNFQKIPKPYFQNKYKHQSQKELSSFNNINNNKNIEQKIIEPKSNSNINNIKENNKNNFLINKTNIPLPDQINTSSFPYTKQSSFNKNNLKSSFTNPDNNNFYDQFMPKSKLNNSYINKETSSYDKKFFSINDARKEISSDALDNLFDFNIGKELEPEPDIMIENNN